MSQDRTEQSETLPGLVTIQDKFWNLILGIIVKPIAEKKHHRLVTSPYMRYEMMVEILDIRTGISEFKLVGRRTMIEIFKMPSKIFPFRALLHLHPNQEL